MGDEPTIAFRPMTEADLPVVEGWFRAEHTHPWWSYEVDREEIGEPSRIGGGIGTRAIGAFVRDIVFSRGEWPAVSAGPDPANGASIRVLEKNGFRVAGGIETSWGPERLMLLTRSEWARSAEPAPEHGH